MLRKAMASNALVVLYNVDQISSDMYVTASTRISSRCVQKTYCDLEGPRDISVWKIASEVPSTTPTAIIAG